MYCQACGVAITHAVRYCNRCGTALVAPHDAAEIKKSEKRLDDYLDGLFWITVFGVALTVGGMVGLKKLLFSDGFIIAFLVLSSSAFLINLALSLWVIYGIVKRSKEIKVLVESTISDTSELEPRRADPGALPPVPSVTENTTRSFEPIHNKRSNEG